MDLKKAIDTYVKNIAAKLSCRELSIKQYMYRNMLTVESRKAIIQISKQIKDIWNLKRQLTNVKNYHSEKQKDKEYLLKRQLTHAKNIIQRHKKVEY